MARAWSLDPLDRRLLRELRRNARAPHVTLARALGTQPAHPQGDVSRAEAAPVHLPSARLPPGRASAVPWRRMARPRTRDGRRRGGGGGKRRIPPWLFYTVAAMAAAAALTLMY